MTALRSIFKEGPDLRSYVHKEHVMKQDEVKQQQQGQPAEVGHTHLVGMERQQQLGQTQSQDAETTTAIFTDFASI